jgi:hypothetical protein
MTSQDTAERVGTHGKNLWAAIGKVEKLNASLGGELGREYTGLLEAISETLDRMMKVLGH